MYEFHCCSLLLNPSNPPEHILADSVNPYIILEILIPSSVNYLLHIGQLTINLHSEPIQF